MNQPIVKDGKKWIRLEDLFLRISQEGDFDKWFSEQEKQLRFCDLCDFMVAGRMIKLVTIEGAIEILFEHKDAQSDLFNLLLNWKSTVEKTSIYSEINLN